MLVIHFILTKQTYQDLKSKPNKILKPVRFLN
jgi:hypothetical protein